MQDLNEYLSPYNATQVIIHHSGKQKGASPVMASRGSTSLTAALVRLLALNGLTGKKIETTKGY